MTTQAKYPETNGKPTLRLVDQMHDPLMGLPCDSEPHGADDGWFHHEEDMDDLPGRMLIGSLECGPEARRRPPRLSPHPRSPQARRPHLTYVIAGALLGAGLVILGVLTLLPRGTEFRPLAPALPPPVPAAAHPAWRLA